MKTKRVAFFLDLDEKRHRIKVDVMGARGADILSIELDIKTREIRSHIYAGVNENLWEQVLSPNLCEIKEMAENLALAALNKLVGEYHQVELFG